MSGFLEKQPRKAPEPKLKPEDIGIKSFETMLIPGNVAGTMNIVIWGLGTDDEMYRWNDEKRLWFEQ